jgi:hypothetical protein
MVQCCPWKVDSYSAGCKICYCYGRGTQIFQKYRSHLQILGTRRVTWSKFHTEDWQILGAMVQNLVTQVTCYEISGFIAMFTTAVHLSTSSGNSIQFPSSQCVSQRCILILSSHPYTKQVHVVVTFLNLYLRVAWFESWKGHLLSWRNCLWFSSDLPCKFLD